MPAEPLHRHNGGPLSDEDRRKLWDHVRAMEVLDEQAIEVRLDIAARKSLAKQDGFDTNMIAVILKRRKAAEGETRAADDMIRVYKDGLRDQGALPLEQTRKPATPRRPLQDIAEDLHGEALPDMPERPDREVRAAAAELDRLARESGGTITLRTGDGEHIATFGDDPF